MSYRLPLLIVCASSMSAVMAADQMPHFKAGLWQVSLVMMGKPGSEKICLDDATEKLMYRVAMSASQKNCTKTDIHSTGSQMTSDSVCKIGTSTRTSHTVMTFSGDSAYHTDITTHVDPPVSNHADTKSTMDGKWLGACPADMKPGDAVVTVEGLPQPMRMNLKDVLGN